MEGRSDKEIWAFELVSYEVGLASCYRAIDVFAKVVSKIIDWRIDGVVVKITEQTRIDRARRRRKELKALVHCEVVLQLLQSVR